LRRPARMFINRLDERRARLSKISLWWRFFTQSGLSSSTSVASRLADPVTADSRTWRDRNNRLERSAARLDYLSRSDVRLITRDEHIGQPELARDDKALPQDLGGVSASAIRRQDTEPDVPANLSELLGEPVSDRRTTDYSSAYFRDEESRRNPSGREANPGALLLKGRAISVPIRLGRQPGSEGKVLGLHLTMRLSNSFVAAPQGAADSASCPLPYRAA
jgi:hypothetical protein